MLVGNSSLCVDDFGIYFRWYAEVHTIKSSLTFTFSLGYHGIIINELSILVSICGNVKYNMFEFVTLSILKIFIQKVILLKKNVTQLNYIFIFVQKNH